MDLSDDDGPRDLDGHDADRGDARRSDATQDDQDSQANRGNQANHNDNHTTDHTDTDDQTTTNYEFRPCPRCNTPIRRTTIIGPTDAVAGPCGCRIAPPIPDQKTHTNQPTQVTHPDRTDES
ncbi:hypothetical protein [Natrialba sp. SSL1]|uniref:hypothetical protein n=1 Tax=Natrialba sp. SSL1 TaxID=1869245 RepID=UPI0008F839EF|nr:hypothetical protein [Natrialba sp. SSL1]OIB57036.1 hypothetical protein BBD46_14925 [Natrialba sp. SSL1]